MRVDFQVSEEEFEYNYHMLTIVVRAILENSVWKGAVR
jgi:hypothetical protein